MEVSTIGWIGLVIILLINSIGIYWLLLTICSALIFCIGAVSFLYYSKLSDVETYSKRQSSNPLESSEFEISSDKLLNKFLTRNNSEERCSSTTRIDNRVTGSEVIDNSLQEILNYVIRDYILPWYNLISLDKEFNEVTIRQSVQTFAVNVSTRIKDIDWIPYLTQRLVDDAATHLRLYKHARVKTKLQSRTTTTTKNSPSRKNTTVVHKRNKSETDIAWYKRNNNQDVDKNIVGNSKFYDTHETQNNVTLEDHFFHLELRMEKHFSRKLVCTDNKRERDFLNEVLETLLYILLPENDFKCRPVRFLVRDIVSHAVILPLIDRICDPDCINQIIIKLCLKNTQVPSDVFLTTLRISENLEELKTTKDLIQFEIHNLSSRDTTADDLSIKQQLNSLSYVVKLIDNRLKKIETNNPENDQQQFENAKTIDLTLEQILKNNLGLAYFMDFISNRNKQMDLFFYLNIEGWKDSVTKKLLDVKTRSLSTENVTAIYDIIRSTAQSIYDHYLSNDINAMNKNEEKIQLNRNIVENLHLKIININEKPNERWFDEIQEALFEKMRKENLNDFKKSKIYIKLLQELDLVQQNFTDDQIMENNWDGKNNDHLNVKTIAKHTRSFSDVATLTNSNNCKEIIENIDTRKQEELMKINPNKFTLTVEIIETGTVREKNKTFGIYATRVNKQYTPEYIEEWHIYRRYSDFYDLNSKVKEKYPDLAKLTFPGKKTFHNMDRAVLERRMKMLGDYMRILCQSDVINSHYGLRELLMGFLEQGDYDRVTAGPISTTINTLVNPIKSGMKTIKNMPEQLINTVDEVVGNISKVFQNKDGCGVDRQGKVETSKVGASIEETDDNIPLRIMLLLMDEIFDLKSRNQWLRRRIVTFFRQILRAMFGDIVNRRILDFVSFMTSPKNVAYYLNLFKQSHWPNGVRNDIKTERTIDTKYRTRIAAKAALLSLLSDELKHLIGSETTRRGLITVFDLFQQPILNRRLFYVLLEGVLTTLFPEKNMIAIFEKLHCKNR